MAREGKLDGSTLDNGLDDKDDFAARSQRAMVERAQDRDVLAFSTTPMSTAQWLKQCLAETISLRAGPQALDQVSFEGVVRYLTSGACTNVITMAGAGISTSAGIPDYRSPGTGLFETMKEKYHITDPSELFSLDHFLEKPGPFFERSKLFFELSPKPTPCHYFIRLLHEKGLLLRHYTQNIDTLERVAGLPTEKVVEAHGTFHTAHCQVCSQSYTVTWMRERVMADRLPKCEKGRCQGIVRPDIVMYGEPLPPRFAQHVEKDFPVCDLLVIMGTSLAVQPFASLISRVKVTTPRLYINLDNGGMDKNDMGVIFGGGLYFDCPGNLTDVFKQGLCDEVCLKMADLAGWGAELRSLMQRELRQLDKQHTAAAKKKHVTASTTGPRRSTTTTTNSTSTITTTISAVNSSGPRDKLSAASGDSRRKQLHSRESKDKQSASSGDSRRKQTNTSK